MAFPFDIFTRLFEGDWIAWTTLVLFIVVVSLACFLIILWWKMPQFAKAGFINNMIAHRPVVLECFENKKVVFQIPQLFRNGLAYLNGKWFIPAKLWVGSSEDLQEVERQAINAVYNGDGCPAGLYLNYSVKSEVVNPELLAIIQHERELKQLDKARKKTTGTDGIAKYDEPIRISKELFRAALDHIKDKDIQLVPMHLDLPIDIRGLKTMMHKSLSSSEFAEQENRIKENERKNAAFGGNKTTVLTILIVVSVILGIVGLLHDFKVF